MAKRRSKSVEKALKKIHPANIVIIALALVIALAAGYFIGNFVYGKDTLEINGQKFTYVEQGKSVSYSDEGIKYISGGKDMSDKFEIETNMTLVDGKYTGIPDADNELYIIYKITEGRAAGQTLYRVFRAAEVGGDA
jgi:hypothetical protein